MTIKSNEDGQTRYVKHYMTDRWFPRIVGSVGRSTYTSWIWINWCEAGVPLGCSRLRDGGGKSFSSKKCEKRAGAGERQGGGACTHFFNGLFRYIRHRHLSQVVHLLFSLCSF